MVVLHTNGEVYVEGKKIGTCKSMTIERKLNYPTEGCIVTSTNITIPLVGEAAERAAWAISNMGRWLHHNKLRMLLREAEMREFARRKGRKK